MVFGIFLKKSSYQGIRDMGINRKSVKFSAKKGLRNIYFSEASLQCFAKKRQYKRKNHFVKMGLQIMIFDAAHKRRIQGKWIQQKFSIDSF